METAHPSLMAGVFRDQAKANQAIEDLKQGGFREDSIQSRIYNLNEGQAAQAAQDSPELVTEDSRIVVTVMAGDRDQEAVGILVANGANNSDIPPGTILENGSIIRADPQTGTVPAGQPVDAADLSNDSFYSKGQLPGQSSGDTVI